MTATLLDDRSHCEPSRTRRTRAAGSAPAPTDHTRLESRLAMCDGMIDLAAALFYVSGRELRRPGRCAMDIARVRQIAMYVTHVTLRLSMNDVGQGFGRDRTTVLHACHVVEDLRDDAEFDRIVSVVERVATAAFRARGMA